MRKNYLASLASRRGTFVGSSRRRRKAKGRRKSNRRVGRKSCIAQRQCRNSVGMFTMCGYGVKRYKVRHCRNRRGRFTRVR